MTDEPTDGYQGAAPIRVFIVDDEDLVRLGLRSVLDGVPQLALVGEAERAAEAVERLDALEPDVVVLDEELPDGSGIDLCRELRAERENLAVVILAGAVDERQVLEAVLAGASGVLLKDRLSSRLVDAVECAARGDCLLDPSIAATLLEWVRREVASGEPLLAARLTAQEWKVLQLIADGRTNREIARELFVSENTTKTHVANILRKLRVTRRIEAAALVARLAQDRAEG